MKRFVANRGAGVFYAVAANLFFAGGNLFTSSYPGAGGVFLWRGMGSCGLLLLRRKTFNKKTAALGLFHATHMLAFVLAIRVGPAWLAPAVLSGVPAALWFWGKQKSGVVNAAVVTMALCGLIFSWDSKTTITFLAFALSLAAGGLVVVRMHYASMWVGQYEPNSALLIAYMAQMVVGAGVWVFGGDVPFVLWMVAGMATTGVLGHLALYETARHCSPSIAAALAPLSVIVTAAGFVLLGGQMPTITQIVTATTWMIAGVTVAIVAQNTKVHQKK